ncbi:hypothetical protein [Abditibacterium utsteinense]|nr:hypothetical protein [Abditibacterium utsteinense]
MTFARAAAEVNAASGVRQNCHSTKNQIALPNGNFISAFGQRVQ